MGLKKIKDNYFENLKMSKYDLLVNVINEIGNFPYIMSGIYLNNEKIRSGEYQGLGINIGWNDEDETALYIFEYENEIEDIERIYYTYEEMLCYLLMYHLQHMNEYSDMIAFVEQEFLNFQKNFLLFFLSSLYFPPLLKPLFIRRFHFFCSDY